MRKIRVHGSSYIWNVDIWHLAPTWIFTQSLSLISFSTRLYIISDLNISSSIPYTQQATVNLCIIKQTLWGVFDILSISILSFAQSCGSVCYWIWGGHPILMKSNEIWRLVRQVLTIAAIYWNVLGSTDCIIMKSSHMVGLRLSPATEGDVCHFKLHHSIKLIIMWTGKTWYRDLKKMGHCCLWFFIKVIQFWFLI